MYINKQRALIFYVPKEMVVRDLPNVKKSLESSYKLVKIKEMHKLLSFKPCLIVGLVVAHLELHQFTIQR